MVQSCKHELICVQALGLNLAMTKWLGQVCTKAGWVGVRLELGWLGSEGPFFSRACEFLLEPSSVRHGPGIVGFFLTMHHLLRSLQGISQEEHL